MVFLYNLTIWSAYFVFCSALFAILGWDVTPLVVSIVNLWRRCEEWMTIRAGTRRAQAALDCYMETADRSKLDEATAIWARSLQGRSAPLTGLWELTLQLALSHWILYQLVKNQDHLQHSIAIGEHALILQPSGRVNRGMALGNLGICLYERFEATGDPADIEEAVNLLSEARSLRTQQHPERPNVLNNLTQALISRAKCSEDFSTIDDMLLIAREALEANPSGSSARRISTRNLAILLERQFDRTSNIRYMNDAIVFYEETLALCPDGFPERDEALSNLANAYEIHHTYTGDNTNLSRTVHLAREALRLRPPSHSKRYLALVNLAISLIDYSRVFDDGGDLDEALNLLQHAVALLPSKMDDTNYCFRVFCNLAAAHTQKYRRMCDVGRLEEAIRNYENALSLSFRRGWERNFAQIGLSTSLHSYFVHTGNEESLNQSTQLSKEALAFIEQNELGAQSRRSRHAILINLANTLSEQSRRSNDPYALKDAHLYAVEAVRLSPKGQPGRVAALLTAARVSHWEYLLTGDTDCIDRMAQYSQEATSSCSPEHPDLARCLYVHSMLLLNRYMAFGDSRRLGEVTEVLKHILDIYPDGHSERYDILRSLACLHLADDSPCYDLPTALYYATTAVSDIHGNMRERFRIGCEFLRLVDWNELQRMGITPTSAFGESMLTLYQRTIDLLPLVANYALDLSTRLNELANSEKLATNAATLAVKLGRPKLAIEILENARGVFWAQALRLRDTGLDAVPPNLAEELRLLLHDLDRSSMSPSRCHDQLYLDEALAHRREQSRRAQEIIEKIRHLPGLDRFLLGPSFESLSLSAMEGPVVILIANQDGCHALILPSANIDPLIVPLPNLSLSTLSQLATHVRESETHRGVFRDLETSSNRLIFGVSKPSSKSRASKAEMVLSSLWRSVVKPIITVLNLKKLQGAARPCLRWCPTGEFVFVPIHAAGIYTGSSKECCSDYLVSSYAPTLSALLKARNNLSPIPRAHVQAVLIAEPAAPGLEPLHNVEDEVRTVGHMLTSASVNILDDRPPSAVISFINEQGTTIENVKKRMSHANILHLACHGLQDPLEPLKSGFYLRDGCLSVSEIMRLDLHRPVFAFLSACETAKGDKKHPDQFVHLAAAMLFAGYRSIVATMWTMGDADGPDIASIVYEELLKAEQIDLRTVPYALDRAVCVLRDKLPADRWATFVHIGI